MQARIRTSDGRLLKLNPEISESCSSRFSGFRTFKEPDFPATILCDWNLEDENDEHENEFSTLIHLQGNSRIARKGTFRLAAGLDAGTSTLQRDY